MLISIKILRKSAFLRVREAQNAVFLLINVEMPTIVGILTFMSRKMLLFLLINVEMSTIVDILTF